MADLGRQKRIAIVLPDLGGGGAERLHLNLANDWVQRGLEVEFILLKVAGALLPLLSPEIRVHGLGVSRLRETLAPLRAHLQRSLPDVTLAAMWPLTSMAALAWYGAGRPGRLFLSDHTQLSVSRVHEMSVPSWVMRSAIASTYRLADGVIAVSSGVKDDLCSLGRLARDHVEVIHNPTAVGKELVPRGDGVGLWKPTTKHRVLSVGTLKVQKDHETLIRAFALIPASMEAELAILGDGPLLKPLATLVESLGLGERVKLHGFAVDPYPWFRSADVFVLSSRWEGFANVIVEALSHGLAIVSTDCPSGPSEILEGGRHGRLVQVRDQHGLARAIVEALGDRPDRQALFRRSRDFTVEAISSQYLSHVLGGSAPPESGRRT